MMTNFKNFGLSEALNISLEKMDYSKPTPIQAEAIPLALDGHDILGSAQTGTGKTAAFSIPMIESLIRNPEGSAMILTPTRELAKQVLDVVHNLIGRKSDIKTAFIIGGEPYPKQMSQLRAKPRVIVGTPGRINDHLRRGSLKLNKTGFLVLDETDRMLDMGFGVQLDEIVKFLPQERQTLMFSATLPKGIVNLSAKYLTDPKRVSVGETNIVAPKIKQEVIRIEQGKKYNELVRQLNDRTGSVIVFVKTKYNADKMADKLRKEGFTAEGLHGDLRQRKRDKVMKNFRNDNFRVLVATDIAARGLDVPHIEHVVNYDLPQVAEDYIHRMGRTARAGAEGAAISFVASQDSGKWHAIACLLDPSLKTKSKSSNGTANGKGRSRRKPFGNKATAEQNNGSERKRKQTKRSHFDQKNSKAENKKSDNNQNKVTAKTNKKAKPNSFKNKQQKSDTKPSFKQDGTKPFKKKFKAKPNKQAA
jgi:ATP-dependent RNA helicase DeaD